MQPHCEVVEPGERHWDICRRLCVETQTRGPRVSEAWFAALAIEWGYEWITFDRALPGVELARALRPIARRRNRI